MKNVFRLMVITILVLSGFSISFSNTVSADATPMLVLSCFNESRPWENVTFDVFISNSNGSTIYHNTSCTNSLEISYDDVPTGDDIIFQFSSSGYNSRTMYLDINPTVWNNISCYLPYNASLYSFIVINEYNDPIDHVKFTVQKYINTTGKYENISKLYTDGAGQCMIYMINDTSYKILLNKSGYQNKTEEYIADPIYYGTNYPKYFKMYFVDTGYTNETIFNEIITYNGYVGATSLYVNYSDSSGQTINTSIVVYEINTTTGNITIFGYNNKTGNNSFQAIFTNINTSNCYKVVLFLNHTYFGYYHTFFLWCNTSNLTSTGFFDNIFNLNYGTSPGGFGWSNIFGFIILVSGMFAFGQQGSGIAMIVTGGLLVFINSYIGLTVISILASSILIIFGVLVVWANQRRTLG